MGEFGFLDFYAERIGKATERFTKEDWKNAALTAARLLDELVPVPKRPGRPRKQRSDTLVALVQGRWDSKPKLRRGRPSAKYGGLSAESLSRLADDLLSPEVRRRWPKDAPERREEAVRQVLRAVKAKDVYADAAVRAERRFRRKR